MNGLVKSVFMIHQYLEVGDFLRDVDEIFSGKVDFDSRFIRE